MSEFDALCVRPMKILIRFAVFVFAMLLTANIAAARPYVVFDVATGTVLDANEPYQRWYPASLTKLMTVYIAFQAVRDGEKTFTSPVIVSRKALAEPPSKMGFPVGSVLTLDNAIKILTVKSANDIAVAVAESIGGTEAKFVERMNAEALLLGMTGTHFASPNGLFSSENYSNAHDLALLTRALRNNFPEYAGYFDLEAIRFGKRRFRTYNTMIGRFDGADGMKTGFVCESGYNLVATATRGGLTLGAVVLGAESTIDRAETAADLLAKGFHTDFAGKPTLWNLMPEGGTAEPADLRAEICDSHNNGVQHTERDEDGNIVFHTPNLHNMDHDPVTVQVNLGGADGIDGAHVDYANVPKPTPRPEYQYVAGTNGATEADRAGGDLSPDN
jgi:D-alanyl-D-alanine carboxypeptidase